MCTDVETGLIIGCPTIAPNRRNGEISPEEVIRMIGGTYRLASIAVDIGTGELARQTRLVSDELRKRRRLRRRRRRPRMQR